MLHLSSIPKVDKVLSWPALQPLLNAYSRPAVVKAVRVALASLRADLISREKTTLPSVDDLSNRIAALLKAEETASLKRVINGTGVVIHTNLGRAPLAPEVRQALEEAAFCYSNLEFDLSTGERGSRYSHVERLLCELTSAEAALVVNNNAAAVFLALASSALGKEVVVSRGELVEIGGSFRIPDIMRQSGTILREVGTTNRTHPADYRGAISAETALLLKVHCSNFAVIGFTTEVSAEELVEIGREHSLPVMADLGSGNLFDLTGYAGLGEPTVQDYVRAGVDLVTFSGDKLLGGPQAGIIVGSRALVDPLKKHPLLRVLRIDKLSLAALEGTLRLARDRTRAAATIPVLRMLTTSRDELRRRGSRLLRRLRRELHPGLSLSLVDGVSQVGGGALPLAELPTTLLAVRLPGLTPQELERRFRALPVPIIGRISKGEFLLDLRTIQEEDEKLLQETFRRIDD